MADEVPTASPAHVIRKAVGWGLLPSYLSTLDRFRLAAEAGFDGVEIPASGDSAFADDVLEAARDTGVEVHSVLATPDWWATSLSSPDRDVVERAVAETLHTLDLAELWGAGAILLVPALVDSQTSYLEADRRSRSVIRERILPVAESHRIVVGIENVLNGFLLSPVDYARYVDEFESPWLRAYLDVGNCVHGHPEHWISILAGRIARVHLKDVRHLQASPLRRRVGWGNLGDGEIDWAAVRQAFRDAGYEGFMTATGIPPSRTGKLGLRGARVLSQAHARAANPVSAGMLRVIRAGRQRPDRAFVRRISRRFDTCILGVENGRSSAVPGDAPARI